MRLGLVKDIQNHHKNLSRALQVFRERQVDQVVTIAESCDAFDSLDGADKVASVLRACGAIGVWGNHDFQICPDVPDF